MNINNIKSELQEEVFSATYNFIIEKLEDILDELIDLDDIIKSGKAKLIEPVLNEYEDGWFEPYFEINGENLVEYLVGVSSYFEDVIVDDFFKVDEITNELADLLAEIRSEASSIIEDKLEKYIK